MHQQNKSTRKSAAAPWLITGIVLAGVAVLAVSLLPTAWLLELAERLAHSDDVTPERVGRFRLVGVGLAAGNLLLAGLLSTRLRAATALGLSELRRELAWTRPVTGLKQAWRNVCKPGAIHAIGVALVLLVGAGIRLRYVNVPIDYDEAYSFLNFARRPLYQGLSDYSTTNNHLLNTLCMHIQYGLFGQREWALRLHVYAAGIGLVVASYVLGRRLLGPDVALVAAALVATSDVLINYSVNARGYIWVALMTVVLMQAFWRLCNENGHRPGDRPSPAGTHHSPLTPGAPGLGSTHRSPLVVHWVAAWLAAVLGLFATPTMIYSITGCVVWLFSQAIRHGQPLRPRLVGLAVWGAAVALASAWLYAPAVVFRGFQAWQHPFVTGLPSLGELSSRTPAAWRLASTSLAEGPVTSYVPIILAGVGVLYLLGANRRVLGLLAAVPLATLVVMAAQRVAPPPRVFSFIAPLFAIVAATGVVAVLTFVARFARRGPDSRTLAWPGALVAGALSVAGGFAAYRDPLPGGLRPAFLIEDVAEPNAAEWAAHRATPPNQLWRLSVQPALAEVQRHARQGDRVIVALPADLPLLFYATRVDSPFTVGGRPQPGERLWLVAPRGYAPRTAIDRNPSLEECRQQWLLEADWRPLTEIGELSIWKGHPSAEASTESGSN